MRFGGRAASQVCIHGGGTAAHSEPVVTVGLNSVPVLFIRECVQQARQVYCMIGACSNLNALVSVVCGDIVVVKALSE